MEGVIPPRGWRPRGFLTQKIMKINRTSNAMGKMTMDENSINLAKAIISDIIDEVAITKGAMILDGYDEEDSCIHYMNGLVKELSDFTKKINK